MELAGGTPWFLGGLMQKPNKAVSLDYWATWEKWEDWTTSQVSNLPIFPSRKGSLEYRQYRIRQIKPWLNFPSSEKPTWGFSPGPPQDLMVPLWNLEIKTPSSSVRHHLDLLRPWPPLSIKNEPAITKSTSSTLPLEQPRMVQIWITQRISTHCCQHLNM